MSTVSPAATSAQRRPASGRAQRKTGIAVSDMRTPAAAAPQRTPIFELAPEERDADEQRVEEAVVRDRLAEQGEPVARDERAPEQAVELLVGGDPGGGDATRERESRDGRDEHQAAEGQERAIDAAAARHHETLPVEAARQSRRSSTLDRPPL